MAYVATLMNSGNIQTELKVRDFSPTIATYGPRYCPIMLFAARPIPAPYQEGLGYKEDGVKSMSLDIRTVKNFKYEWAEDTFRSTQTQVNNGGGYNSSDTSIVVDDATLFAVNDIVDAVATGEILLVTAVNTGTNTLTVVRSWGATAAASIADNAYLLIVGNAFPEAGAYQFSPETTESIVYNYLQDSRDGFGGTFVLDRHELYGQDERTKKRAKHLLNHQRRMEASLIFGERADSTAGSGSEATPRKTTGGLLEFLTSNVTAVGGTLTKTVWNNWLRDLFVNGEPEKVIFCSSLVAGAINNFAADSTAPPASQLWVMQNQKSFGMNINSYVTKWGTVHIVVHGMLSGNLYDGYAIAVEPSRIRLVKAQGGFFMNLREDIIKDGAHRWVDEYASHFGLEVKNPQVMGVLTGVTG